ncbi:aldehyde dehydrogenase family protein [Thermopolyspora sp. NPDC052614]|uniref:aldehyde dehydrogenase family protein n=1 Tax=Thermopolyspora sp. NPDC052614 TaxID=3155682 RepID=UPI0034394FB4
MLPSSTAGTTRQIGKPYAEALGEALEIIDTCDFFLGEGRRLYGHRSRRRCRTRTCSPSASPVGIAAVITAGNFPGRGPVPSWYLMPAPATATGSALVSKFADKVGACRHPGGLGGMVIAALRATNGRVMASWLDRDRLSPGKVDLFPITFSDFSSYGRA